MLGIISSYIFIVTGSIKSIFLNLFDTKIVLDLSNINNVKVVEIISPYNISGSLEYQIRYIKYPKPIIITNLDDAFPSDNLTIDGISAETACELNTEVCREILDRAVMLATADYRPQNLQVKAQMSQINE